MKSGLGYAVNAAVMKIFPVLLGIRTFTYDRSHNYWFEMSCLQITCDDRKHYYQDSFPVYAQDKER